MLSAIQLRALVQGIVQSNNAAKQDLGRRFAKFMGFEPGPRGPDDGIDGWLEHQGKKIHFQCKLSAHELGKKEAQVYYAEIKRHLPDLAIILAGVGFKPGFVKCLFSFPELAPANFHLLTLKDLFQENAGFQEALKHLPALAGLADCAQNQGL